MHRRARAAAAGGGLLRPDALRSAATGGIHALAGGTPKQCTTIINHTQVLPCMEGMDQ